MSVDATANDVRDRLGLAKRWLVCALGPKADLAKPLAKALMRLWIETHKAIVLDDLGNYVKWVEAHPGAAVSQPLLVPWLTLEAVRAVWLDAELHWKAPDL